MAPLIATPVGVALMAGSWWGLGGGMEGSDFGISDLPKRGVSGFHVEALVPVEIWREILSPQMINCFSY